MSIHENPNATFEGKTPPVCPGISNPVNVYMEDSLGAIFLGFLSGVLLIGWMHAEARNRALMTELGRANGNHPFGTH